MNLSQNIQFTNLFKAGGRLHEFNFRRSNGLEGLLFTVDVADQKGDRNYIIFRLEEKCMEDENKNNPGMDKRRPSPDPGNH